MVTLKILVNNDLKENKFSIITKDIIENNIEEKKKPYLFQKKDNSKNLQKENT